MSGLQRLLSARHLVVAAALTLLACALAWALPQAALVVEFASPIHPRRGVGVMEAAGVLLACVLPALQINHLNVAELLAVDLRKPAMLTHSLLLMVLPVVPTLVWLLRIQSRTGGRPLPPWPPLAGSMLLISCAATIVYLLVGHTVGPIITVSGWAAIVVGQHWYGPSFIGGALSTGNSWQVSVPALLLLAGTAAALSYRWRGLPWTISRRT